MSARAAVLTVGGAARSKCTHVFINHSFTQTMGDFLLFSHGDVINYLLNEPLQAGELASRCAEPQPQRLFAVWDRTFEGRDSARPVPPLTAGAGPGAHGAFANRSRARKLERSRITA